MCIRDSDYAARKRSPVLPRAASSALRAIRKAGWWPASVSYTHLVDVSKLDTRVTLFGQEFAYPILLAPTGGQRLIHPEGELAAVRGAAAANATYVISSSASIRVEDIAKAATGPVWFQLYVQKDRGFTRNLVQACLLYTSRCV